VSLGPSSAKGIRADSQGVEGCPLWQAKCHLHHTTMYAKTTPSLLFELAGDIDMTTLAQTSAAIGWWLPQGQAASSKDEDCCAAFEDLSLPLAVVELDGAPAIAPGGSIGLGSEAPEGALPLLAYAPAQRIAELGDASFCADHGLRFPYVAGAMANGITSVEVVEAMSRAGMIGFFGAAGLHPERVEAALIRFESELGELPWGVNLIHSPGEPEIESRVAELYIKHRCRVVSASAYMGLTLPLLRYRLHGIRHLPDGRIETPNRVIAKVSRVEVAEKFFRPAPAKMLAELVAAGHLTEAQAALAAKVPVARDLTAEADSGGHTDNRPALTLLPTMLALAARIQREEGYDEPLRVGAAGGIATPSSAAAAFAMGAAYILTGSVNQACLESGSSDPVRKMLAECGQADITMAPAADMFEMGVKVQVLKRGTMFAMRGAKLFDLYRSCEGLHDIPAAAKTQLEKQIFRQTLDEAWASTRSYWNGRDPNQVARAEADPKHKMALVFRSYLGQASRWANAGEASRRIDYQVWCGPAMGAFNEWTRGSFLAATESRDVVTVAYNLLYGAALRLRARSLSGQGLRLPGSWLQDEPRPRNEVEAQLR